MDACNEAAYRSTVGFDTEALRPTNAERGIAYLFDPSART
jgi:hypothetical protein